MFHCTSLKIMMTMLISLIYAVFEKYRCAV